MPVANGKRVTACLAVLSVLCPTPCHGAASLAPRRRRVRLLTSRPPVVQRPRGRCLPPLLRLRHRVAVRWRVRVVRSAPRALLRLFALLVPRVVHVTNRLRGRHWSDALSGLVELALRQRQKRNSRRGEQETVVLAACYAAHMRECYC